MAELKTQGASIVARCYHPQASHWTVAGHSSLGRSVYGGNGYLEHHVTRDCGSVSHPHLNPRNPRLPSRGSPRWREASGSRCQNGRWVPNSCQQRSAAQLSEQGRMHSPAMRQYSCTHTHTHTQINSSATLSCSSAHVKSTSYVTRTLGLSLPQFKIRTFGASFQFMATTWAECTKPLLSGCHAKTCINSGRTG